MRTRRFLHWSAAAAAGVLTLFVSGILTACVHAQVGPAQPDGYTNMLYTLKQYEYRVCSVQVDPVPCVKQVNTIRGVAGRAMVESMNFDTANSAGNKKLSQKVQAEIERNLLEFIDRLQALTAKYGSFDNVIVDDI